MRALVTACLLSAVSALGWTAETAPVLQMELTDSTVRLANLQPFGSVVIQGLARIPRGYMSDVWAEAVTISDADGDGRVEWEPPVGIPLKSAWVAVDQADGRTAAVAPAAFGLRQVEFPGGGVARGIRGQLSRLDLRGMRFRMLVVRPGVGAWHRLVTDHGWGDDDGATNGRVSVELATFTPLASSPGSPDQFKPGDVVVLGDTTSLEIMILGGLR